MNNIDTIEDLLEIFAGLKTGPKIVVQPNDATIMFSIARQVFKGTALTDRQLDLVKNKLHMYQEQFVEANINFNKALEHLRMPLRQIDRSKYIKIVAHHEMLSPTKIYESYKEKWKWIKIRFPFSKKTISLLDTIPKNDYEHKKGSHEHFFKLTEQNVYNIIACFKDKNFEIDSSLIDIFDIVSKFENKKEDYLPGINNNKIINCPERTVNHLTSTLGYPTTENLFKYKDRSMLYGLHFFNSQELEKSCSNLSTLTQKIVNRSKSNFLVNSDNYGLETAIDSVITLDRLPILVVLGSNDPLTDLTFVHKSFNKIKNINQSVLFRLDNNTNKPFNDYIKTNNLNNVLDSSTKVVYISNEKLPKTLFKSNINFEAVLLAQSQRTNNKVRMYLNVFDFIMHYDSDISPMMRKDICQLVN